MNSDKICVLQVSSTFSSMKSKDIQHTDVKHATFTVLLQVQRQHI